MRDRLIGSASPRRIRPLPGGKAEADDDPDPRDQGNAPQSPGMRQFCKPKSHNGGNDYDSKLVDAAQFGYGSEIHSADDAA
jgi:hypothetical protein